MIPPADVDLSILMIIATSPYKSASLSDVCMHSMYLHMYVCINVCNISSVFFINCFEMQTSTAHLDCTVG